VFNYLSVLKMHGEQWDFQNSEKTMHGTFSSLDHDWMAWRTVGFSKQ
jgi:hypothetical protein